MGRQPLQLQPESSMASARMQQLFPVGAPFPHPLRSFACCFCSDAPAAYPARNSSALNERLLV